MSKQPSEIRLFLPQIKLCQGLAEVEVDALAQIASLKPYAKGEVIFHEGDEGNGLFVVMSGRVKVFKTSAEGKEQILQLFGIGEHFAEVPAFDGQCFPASAVALETSKLLFFPRQCLLELLEKQPKLAINIIAIFANRLRQFAQLIENLSLKEVPGRLANYLLYFSDRNGGSEIIELDITKAQLAALLGTIPETLSRVLSKLSSEGVIAIEGSKIKLLDKSRLIVLAGGTFKRF